MPTPQNDPQGNGISFANKELAKSNKLLDKAIKFNGPVKTTPKPAPAPAPKAPKAKAPSTGLIGDQGTDSANGIKANADNVKEYIKNTPKMHKGGVVQEDGLKNLKKGEVVIPEEKAEEGKKIMALKDKAGKGIMAQAKEEEDNEPKSEEKHESKKAEKKESKKDEKKDDKKDDKKSGKKHSFHRTEIVHHKNGSHTVTHHPHPPKPSADGGPSAPAEPVSYAAPDMASMQQGMQDNLGGGPEGGSEPAAASAAPAEQAAPAQV